MDPIKTAAIAFSFLCFQAGIASADEASPPNTTATRPAKEHPDQTSMPSAAPPATRTETTGSVNQDPITKQMNDDAKKKLETEGK
jgi:hypothetical protein